MTTYEVQWSKRYYASGCVEIDAESEEQARELILERIGDYEGSMQYDADGDDVFILGEKPEPSPAYFRKIVEKMDEHLNKKKRSN